MNTHTRQGACDACLARSWLLARLGGHLEHHRRHIEEVLALPDAELLEAVGGRQRTRVAAERADLNLDRLRATIRRDGLETLCRCDPRYPERLWSLNAPPAVLHVAGDVNRLLELLDGEPVAIVGSRRASPYGLEVARGLARDLAAAGITVISGMALGIDAAAHGGALSLSEGDDEHGVDGNHGLSRPGVLARTVAVLPGSAARPYPRAKRQLHRRIVAAGAAVSELPPGASVWRWTFPARNRIIAALAALTVVVEAGARSGSLVTAGIARRLGRPVGAVPGRITTAQAWGSNELLAEGARVIRGAQDALDGLYGSGTVTAPGARRPPPRPELQPLLEALSHGYDTPAALSRAGLGPLEGLAALAALELAGHVRRGPGGGYLVLV